MVSSEKADYDKAVDLARKEYVKNSKAQAKERIDKLVDYINVNEQFLIREAKEEIKNIVTLGQKVILDTYQENPKLSRELLFEKLRTKLRDTRFFSDLSGYYFIYDLNGTNIMHGANRALEGLDLMDVQDGNGKYITKDILSLLAKNDGAYYDWTWKNPEDEMYRKKIGYMALVKPLNLFIGSARYEDEILTKIKKETQKLLLNTHYGEHGYIFAYDYDGYTISHGDTSLVGENRLSVVTNGQHIIKDIIEGGRSNPEGFFMSYVASYHPDAKDRNKVSFIRPIPEFEWVIRMGAYLNEENETLLGISSQ